MRESKNNVNYTEEVYDSARLRHPLVEELLALYKYRTLVKQFVSRTIKSRYKRSFLGVLWTLLNPLMTMVVLTIVFSHIFKFAIENYSVYVLGGLIFWGFFSHTTHTAMGEMIWSGGLLNRIYVPKTVFAVSAIGVGLVNISISLVPLLLIALAQGVRLTLAILVLPVSILLLSLFSLGIGLILAAAVVYFADILPVYEVVLTMWMYATPIIYPVDAIPPSFAWVLRYNPMYYLIQVFRTPIYDGVLPSLQVWIVAVVASLVTFILGGLIFTWKSNEYAYRL
jgi:ABC-type polysaccharide/polyol phosphate export permease